MGAKESVNKVKAQDLTIMDEKKISIRVLASESSKRLITNCYFGDYIYILGITRTRHGMAGDGVSPDLTTTKVTKLEGPRRARSARL